MPHPNDILPYHPQVHEGSCPAWGLEAIVKFTGNQLGGKHPYQDTCQQGCDFRSDLRDDMRNRWGIETRYRQYGDHLGPFEANALESIKRGFYPLLSVPSFVIPDWENKCFKVMCHVFVVIGEAGRLVFLTRGWKDAGVRRVTWEGIHICHAGWVNAPHCVPKDSLANALFYTAPASRQ